MLGFGVVFGGTALALATLSGWSLLRHQPAAAGLRVLSVDELAVVAAIATTYFPDANTAAIGTHIDAYMAALYPRERQLLSALLRAMNRWPQVSLSSTKSFVNLSQAARVDVLRAFETSSRAERRLLTTTLRTSIAAGAFEDPAFLSSIGFVHGCTLPELR
jgi:Gluconate 2-dehydrogenase subunit 3